MKKYGFFGGSFNPVTKAHVELAREILDKYELDKVIFVPMGDNYKKEGLISEIHRFNMLKLATKNYDKLEVSNIELNQARSLTTLEAFCKIERAYPNVDKYYIMGADNINKMMLSDNFKELVENYKYIVIERSGVNCKELINSNELLAKNKEHLIIMKNKNYNETSSTRVRQEMKENTTTVDTLDEAVLEYVEKNGLYR